MSVVLPNHADHTRSSFAVQKSAAAETLTSSSTSFEESTNLKEESVQYRSPLERDLHNQIPHTIGRKHFMQKIAAVEAQDNAQSSSSRPRKSDESGSTVGDENNRSNNTVDHLDIESGIDLDTKKTHEDYRIAIQDSSDTKRGTKKEILSSFEENANYIAEEKNRVLQEQATRRAAINKEQQNILMMMEKEDAFWKKQEDRFKLMVKRQNLAKKTSDELQQFITKWNKTMLNLAQGYRNLTPYGGEETGTLRQACIAQGILSKSMADHYSEMRERILTDTGREASDLTKNMFVNSKQLEASGKRLSKVIKTARSKCMDSWVAYAKAVQERQRLELADKHVTRDPFVACRLYDRDVANLRKQEMQYRKEMTRLFRDFKVEDGRRIDKTQSIILDYLLAQKAMFEDGIKFTESAIDAVKGIDRETDVNEFIRQADLIVAPSDSKGKRAAALHADNVFEIQPPHRDPKTLSRLYAQECHYHGTLYRQGKFLKTTWKKSYVVLSRSGFFHQFDSKNAVQPEITICLRDCQVNLAPKEDECAFEIVEPSRGLFSVVGGATRHYYKAESDEEFVDWMIAIKKHIPESKIKINEST